MRVSEIRVNQIRVNQGLGVDEMHQRQKLEKKKRFSKLLLQSVLELQ